MQTPALERVLSCPNLPSLPAVAMKVLELTRDPKVSIATISHTVQTDPALSTKVLRTVNSSYYALSTPCPNISRAMSLLGLNTVKAIVLGFSLVDCTKRLSSEGAFDMESYWRRAVYGAAAARALAMAARSCDPEEAFVGALLQDIGMLASFAALKKDYLQALSGAPADHDEVVAIEKRELGFDHAEVGRMLAEKWRLPPQIVQCVAEHHGGENVTGPHKQLVRTVCLANLAAGSLTLANPQRKTNAFIAGASRWFDMRLDTAKGLIEQAAKGARELSKSLDMSVGQAPDVTAILSEAHDQLAVTQEAMQQETVELKNRNEELARKTVTDGLTGAFNRAHFDRECKAAADRCRTSGQPYAVIFLDADKFKSVNDTHGHQAGDAVLMELSNRLRSVADRAGVFCRYGGEEFVLVAPGVNLEKGKKLAELLRQVVNKTPFDLAQHGIANLCIPISISVGVASVEPGLPSAAWTPEQATHAADQAVYAAKQGGRNCVRWAKPDGTMSHAVVVAPVRRVLILEDDPFTSKLVQKVLATNPSVQLDLARNLAEARQALSPGKPPIHGAILDLNVPDGRGTELLPLIRSHTTLAKMPVGIMSGDASEANRLASIAAGANVFFDKVEFLSDTAGAIRRLLELLDSASKAA